MHILNQSWETSNKMKKLLLSVAVTYLATFLIGYILVYIQMPFVMKLFESILPALSDSPIYTPIIGALTGGNLVFAIAYTFLVNLSLGAFVSTTLPGVIPLVGGVGSVAVTGIRGFIIGVAYYEVFKISLSYTALGVGTAILELGAYVFSATAGINISLSTISPKRYQVDSRWLAFKMAWKDASRIYVIVIILLVLGAIWEMEGLYLLAS